MRSRARTAAAAALATVLLAAAAGATAHARPSEPAAAQARALPGNAEAAGPARRLLSRPARGETDLVACGEHACVHWVDVGRDAPPLEDADSDGVPDYVELVRDVLEEVWAKEIVELGYRPPEPDLTSVEHGPDGRLDVYLEDTGKRGVFGYTSTDDPGAYSSEIRAVSAYLVLDDDFSTSQFPTGTPSEDMLRVTVAHEFFHAVQFAYDFREDAWLVEGTAAWIEDEVYDEIDDNHLFLDASQLRRPDVPLDSPSEPSADPSSGFDYGTWVFWRFLSERLGADVVRRVWELAAAAEGDSDGYSLEALASALGERGGSFRDAFAEFGAANALPAFTYEEGGSYPAPPRDRRVSLSSARPAAQGKERLDHLTTWYGSFRPGPDVRRGTRLLLTLDLPRPARGAAATLVVVSRSGRPTFLPVALDGNGNGTRTVRFARPGLREVILVLTNASERYACWEFTTLSCRGRPLDDGAVFRYQARLIP